ncbi:MAG: 3-methyl-2-oxobutanoate hydroxymethyltransferase, partial [Nitrospirales bacterium]
MMTVPEFRRRKRDGNKLTVVTAYDALFAHLVEEAGIEAILVGDSLGMVVQGRKNTLAVTVEDMCYHTKLVASA